MTLLKWRRYNIYEKQAILLIWLLLCSFIFTAVSTAEEINVDDEILNANIVSSIEALNYSTAPEYLHVFVYNETMATSISDETFSGTNGNLYVYNTNTGVTTTISNSIIAAYTATLDGVYYVDDIGNVGYSDYANTLSEEIAHITGSVTNLDYFNGLLSCVVNNTQILLVETETGEQVSFKTDEEIVSIYQFANDKLIWRDTADKPYLLDILTGEISTIYSEREVNLLMAPYITPNVTNSSAVRSTSTTMDSSFNDITFPLDEFGEDTYFNTSNKNVAKCYHPLDYDNPVNYCRTYGNHSQCYGFALYAHDQF